MRFRAGGPFRRRGPLRRGPPLFGPRSALGDEPLRRLGRAHRLLADGQPGAAAPLFAELARSAQALGMPARAANLHLQAARSWLWMGELAPGIEHAREALGLFAGQGRADLGRELCARLADDLQADGHGAAAEALRAEVEAQPGQARPGAAPASPTSPPRSRLPGACPNCGGPVRSDEVEWIDAHSAECRYCGGVVQTE